MTTSDDGTRDAAPFPDHTTEGDAPDPVVSTAPKAAADEDEDPIDRALDETGVPILPVGGPQAGTALPPTRL